MKTLKNYWWLLLVFIAVTLIFIVTYNGVIPDLGWKKKSLDTLGSVFAKLFIVGALLDQFIAVFFPQDDTDKDQRDQAMNALSIVKDEEKFIQKEILSQQLYGFKNANAMASVQTLNAKLTTFSDTKQVAEDKIAEIDTKRSSFVRKIAFAAGLILAVTGVTILKDFIEPKQDTLNVKIFYFIDIVLTAAVLSGGTSGINELLRIIKDSWKKS